MNVEKQLEYLRSQKENPTGNYRQYLVNIYNLYYQDAKSKGTNWSSGITLLQLVKAAYAGLTPDHASRDMVIRWKSDLMKMGYLCEQKVDGVWRTYILKELDF